MLREAFRPAPLRAESLSEDLAQEANRREQNSRQRDAAGRAAHDPEGDWQPYSYAVFDALAQQHGGQPRPAGRRTESRRRSRWSAILGSYGDKSSDAAAFNRSVSSVLAVCCCRHPPQQWVPAKTDFEAYFNHFSPFYYAMMLYMVAFLLGCFSWLGWTHPAATCVHLADSVHARGPHARRWSDASTFPAGRPSRTSIRRPCSSAGPASCWPWCSNAIRASGIANVVGAFLGFATLLIAHLMTTPYPRSKATRLPCCKPCSTRSSGWPRTSCA